MKHKIQYAKYLLKIASIWAFLIVAAIVSVVLIWETFRPNVVSLFEKDIQTVVAREPEPTDFEIYVSSKEVQTELQLMYKRHVRDELNQEITDLETESKR